MCKRVNRECEEEKNRGTVNKGDMEAQRGKTQKREKKMKPERV